MTHPDGNIVPPLVVIDDERRVELFRSVDAAIGWIPAPELDIWAEFDWYDSEGRRLVIRELPPPREVRFGPFRLKRGGGGGVVDIVDDQPAHAEELSARLRTRLCGRGLDGLDDAQMALPRLIEVAADEFGFIA